MLREIVICQNVGLREMNILITIRRTGNRLKVVRSFGQTKGKGAKPILENTISCSVTKFYHLHY